MRTDVSEFQKELVHQATFLHGQIIGNYAQVEHLLADLALRCASRAEYRDFIVKFPYKIESRLAAVKKLATLPGPISIYRDSILNLIDRILKYE